MTIPTSAQRTLSPRELRGISKELREIIKIAQSEGWSVWKTARSHFRFRPPAGSTGPRCPSNHEDHRGGGRTLTHGSTGSDTKGLDNLRADLRGYGLEGV
ncbi:HicA-like toxin [Streptomyces phage Marky]|nr:HicA-like toxin [Streptomyces phage Marky]